MRLGHYPARGATPDLLRPGQRLQPAVPSPAWSDAVETAGRDLTGLAAAGVALPDQRHGCDDLGESVHVVAAGGGEGGGDQVGGSPASESLVRS
jgi:hypothetical protein